MVRLACVLVMMASSAAWSQQVESPAQRVVELARQVAGRPNDPQLHAKLAVAYFERGATGDAARVQAHSDRAKELDPGVESGLASDLAAAAPGFDPQPATAEAGLADMQAASALPAAGSRPSDAAIRMKLAARLSRGHFAAPTTKFSKNMDIVENLYDPSTDPEAGSWNQREASLRNAIPSGLDPLTKRFVETLKRTVQQRKEAEAKRSPQPGGDEPPDPMLTKGQAFLAYLEGDIAGAVTHLKRTAAAADTLSRRALETMSEVRDDEAGAAPRLSGTMRSGALGAPLEGKPVDDDWGDDSEAERARVATPSRNDDEPVRTALAPPRNGTPGRDEDGTPRRDDGSTPARNDPLTPPRTDADTPDRTSTPDRADAGTPDRAATPDRADPDAPPRTSTPDRTEGGSIPRDQTPPRDLPSAPPEALRRIGQQALEGLEATKTEEVKPPEVTTRLRELAQTQEVGEPLVLDLDGDGRPSLPGGVAPDGKLEPGAVVRFDIDGDGHADLVEWMKAGDALICADVDGDGQITSGRELPGALPGHGDGVAWLERRDLDMDGQLSGREMAGILVWKDDGDARVQPGELTTAVQTGLERILIHGAGGPSATLHGQVRAVWEWWPDMRP